MSRPERERGWGGAGLAIKPPLHAPALQSNNAVLMVLGNNFLHNQIRYLSLLTPLSCSVIVSPATGCPPTQPAR